MRLDGSDSGNLNTSGATANGETSFALDPVARRLYWVNPTSSVTTVSVSYAMLDTPGGADLSLSAPKGWGRGLAIDGGTAYWATGFSVISSAGLSGGGSGALTMTPSPLDVLPQGAVAIDPKGKRIYLLTSNPGGIASSNLDGSDTTRLSTTGAILNGVTDLLIDPANNRIYWSNTAIVGGEDAAFGYADLGGSGGGNLVIPFGGRAATFGIDPETERIYWPNGGRIHTAKLDGTDAKVAFRSRHRRPHPSTPACVRR